MIDARPIARRVRTTVAALLVTASWAGLAAADPAPGETGYRVPAAATSSDQWHAPGARQYTNSSPQDTSTPIATSGQSANPTWRLPNGQSSTADTQILDDDSNPLRPIRQPQSTAVAREPRFFNAPTNAVPISAQQTSGPKNTNATQQQYQQRNTLGPIATRSPEVPNQAYVQPRPLPYRQSGAAQRSAMQSGARSTSNNRPNANTNSGSPWQTMNVAYQAQPGAKKPTPQKSMIENLPTPGGDDYDTTYPDPVMRSPSGPGRFPPFAGPYYQPYGQPYGNCDDGSCPTGCGDNCGPDCGCPCGEPCGEPGCGCQPGCGCPCDGPKKEVFCIGPGDDESCHIVQVRWPKWQEVTVFGESQGFKGPYDRARDSGNFGFNEGFNIGAKIPYAEMGYQFGYRATESQLNGDKDTGDSSFVQSFVTAGIFHRQNEGVQFGIVWDGLIDERTHSENFGQIRSEISLRNCGCHEFGFGATIGLNSNRVDDGTNTNTIRAYQASDQYVLFYRLHGCDGGEGRIYAGVNNDSDGIVGSDMLLPLNDCFSVQGGFAYLIPNAHNGSEGATQEAWNIGIGLVWHWDHQAHKCFDNCYRPLFNVADNGSLIVDQQGN